MNLRKKPMHAKPVMQETMTPITKSPVIRDGWARRCGTFTRAAPRMMGVERRKENLAALSRVRPEASPVVMVIAQRETPGITAGAWEMPMARLVPRVIVFLAFILAPQRYEA